MSELLEELRVLVAVDVQNCFMSNLNGGTFLNMSGRNLLDQYNKSIQLTNAINKLCNLNDLIIFTRDMHPLNHISFGTTSSDDKSEEYKSVEGRPIDPVGLGTWPIHCRDSELKCKSRKDEDIPYIKPTYTDKVMSTLETALDSIDTLTDLSESFKKVAKNQINAFIERIKRRNLSDYVIKGNELSYFFYNILDTKLWDVIKQLNSFKREEVIALQKNGIDSEKGYTDEELGIPSEQNPKEIDYNGKKVVSLWKGERCNQESYSAFNYHLDYDVTNPSSPKIKKDFNSIDKKNTTGLFEYILNKTDGKPKKIVITICGLVGDVCVMHSFLQGITLWEQVYKPLFPEGTICQFKINLDSTYFLGLPGVPVGFGNESNIQKYIDFYKNPEKTPLNFNLNNLTQSIFVTTPYIKPMKHIGGKKCNCPKCKTKRTKKNIKNVRKNRKSRKPRK